MSSTNKIKLVQIIADSSIGGGPKHVFGLLEHIDKTLFDCYLICPPGDLARQARDIPHLEIVDLEMRSKFDLVAAHQINKLLHQIQAKRNPFGPLIVHTHGTRAGFLARAFLPRAYYSVYTEHRWDSDYHLENRINEWLQLSILSSLNRKTDLIIAVSHAVKDFLLSRKLARESRLKVIPNAIDVRNLRPKTYNLKPKKGNHFVIGNVGNLNHQKGHIFLIEAMAEIITHYPHATLEIVGEGEERQTLQEKIKDLKLERHITLLGSSTEPLKQMSKWDVFVLPSIAETFGIVILEAFSAGLPVVASNVGGIKDVIHNRSNGLLVAPENPNLLAAAIMEILANPQTAEDYASAGEDSLEHYDWKKIIKKIEKEYLRLIK